MTKEKTSMFKHEDFSSLLLAFQNSATISKIKLFKK